MKIIITLGEILEKYDWDKACKILGISEWSINEGLSNSSDEVELTIEQAEEIGINLIK